MRLGVKQVAEHLGVSEDTIFRWVERRSLPATQVDGQYRFNAEAVYEWATSRGIPVAGDLFEAQHRDHEVPPFTRALQDGGIVPGLRGDDRRAVLAAAVEKLHLPSHADRDVILQMLLARERLGSTGIGQGFAVPHVRDPVVLRVPHPLVTLLLLDHPIDFGAHDRHPVHSLFLIVTPTIQSHLLILSRLGAVLQDADVRAAIVERRPPTAILAAVERAERAVAEGRRSGGS